MKHFRCYLPDLYLEAKIKVEDDHWQTEDDFKKEIAPLFNLKTDQFQIENMPPKYALTDNKKKYDLNLTIVNKSKDFIFQLPDENRIPVKISHLTSIKFVMEEFKTHKIYFHQKAIDTLQFRLCGIKVPKDYNFSCIPEGSIVYISSKYKLIPIKYRDYQFFLSETQTIADATSLIGPFFKDCDIFQIHDSSIHQMPSLLDKLSNDINYVLYLRRMLNISHINGSSPKLNFIDYLTTVSELKGILASIYSGQEQLTPENIILMDAKKKEITDPKKTLISFQNKFFFDIKTDQPRSNQDQKIEWNINFEFEQNKKFNFLEKLPIDMKMKEIITMISNKYKIEDKIELYYEENYKRIKIDENKSINDVKAKIRPFGVNLIYVKITKNKSEEEEEEEEAGQQKLKEDNQLIDQKQKQRKVGNDQIIMKQKKIKENEQITKQKQKKSENYVSPKKYKTKISKIEEEDSYESSPNLLQLSKLINEDKTGTPKPKINLIKSSSKETPKFTNDEEEDLSSSENKSNSIINIQKPKPKITLIQSDSDDDQEIINKNESKQKQSKSDIKDKNSPSKSPKNSPKPKQKNIQKDGNVNNTNNNSYSPTRNKSNSRLKQQPQNKDELNDKKTVEPLKSRYSFQFNDIKRDIRLVNNVLLKDNEEIIKMWFQIDGKETLDYFTFNEEEKGEEEELDSEKVNMQALANKKIFIKIHQKLNANLAPEKEKEKVTSCKYFYQINSESKINEIELDSDATVLTLKKIIADKNKVDNLSNVKILFAGKDLMNDIVLESLQIGTAVLYVYIRSMEDILLMTAKELIVKK